MNKLSKIRIFVIFVIWRSALFVIAFISTIVIRDFGARFPYYTDLLVSTGLPTWIWGFGNFDGVHYLNIAKSGYFAQYTQSFFPAYPLLIKVFSFGSNYFASGLILSNILFLGSLFLFSKLIKFDFSDHNVTKSTLLFLFFPTSFYFASIYSESLFLFLSLLTFYLARKNKFVLAGITAGIASATRIVGIFLLPAIAYEIYLFIRLNKNVYLLGKLKILLAVLLSVSGLAGYMIYLGINFKDPIYFMHAVPYFSTGRSDSIVFLPQVLFRYFKILTSVNFFSMPFFISTLELLSTVIPLFLIIFFYRSIRKSYLIFMIGCLILPTLTGTLTSMPRYSLMSFFLIPYLVSRYEKYIFFISTIFIILQIILLGLFIRGYWVA